MSYQHNVSRNVYNDIAMAPVAAGTGDTQNGIIIDTAGYESIQFTVYFGALTAGAVTTLKVQYGNAANGSDMDHVVKCLVMLADIGEWAKMNGVYVTFFPVHKPARSAFGTSGLARNGRLEIECIAVLP